MNNYPFSTFFLHLALRRLAQNTHYPSSRRLAKTHTPQSAKSLYLVIYNFLLYRNPSSQPLYFIRQASHATSSNQGWVDIIKKNIKKKVTLLFQMKKSLLWAPGTATTLSRIQSRISRLELFKWQRARRWVWWL